MRNNFAVYREQEKDGFTHLFVATKNAVLRNMKWEQLGDWGKRKHANLLKLTRRHNRKKEKLKIVYVSTF